MNIGFNGYIETLVASRNECHIEYASNDALIASALKVIGDDSDSKVLCIIYSSADGSIVNSYAPKIFKEWLTYIQCLKVTGTFAIVTYRSVWIYCLNNSTRLSFGEEDVSRAIVSKTLLGSNCSLKYTPLLTLFSETFPSTSNTAEYFFDPILGPLDYKLYVSASLNGLLSKNLGKIYNKDITLKLTDDGARYWKCDEVGGQYARLVTELNGLESDLVKFKALIKSPALLEYMREELAD